MSKVQVRDGAIIVIEQGFRSTHDDIGSKQEHIDLEEHRVNIAHIERQIPVLQGPVDFSRLPTARSPKLCVRSDIGIAFEKLDDLPLEEVVIRSKLGSNAKLGGLTISILLLGDDGIPPLRLTKIPISTA